MNNHIPMSPADKNVINPATATTSPGTGKPASVPKSNRITPGRASRTSAGVIGGSYRGSIRATYASGGGGGGSSPGTGGTSNDTKTYSSPKKLPTTEPPRPGAARPGVVKPPFNSQVTKQPSATAGPSSGLRGAAAAPPITVVQTPKLNNPNSYGKKQTFPGLNSKMQTIKHGLFHRGKKPASSMNVILPPHADHSLTGSVMDSQMFPKARAISLSKPSASTASPGSHNNEFSTFNVHVEHHNSRVQSLSPAMMGGQQGKNKMLPELHGKSLSTTLQEHTVCLEKQLEEITKAVYIDKTESTVSNSPFRKFPPTKSSHFKQPEVLHEFIVVSPRKTDSERFKSVRSATMQRDRHGRGRRCYNEHVLKPQFTFSHQANSISNSTIRKAPQTAPVTAIPSSTGMRYFDNANNNNDNDNTGMAVETRDNDETIPCVSSVSESPLTEMGFLQGIRKSTRAPSHFVRDELPPKPHTAPPLLPADVTYETDLLQAALKETVRGISANKSSEDHHGISEEVKPSQLDSGDCESPKDSEESMMSTTTTTASEQSSNRDCCIDIAMEDSEE